MCAPLLLARDFCGLALLSQPNALKHGSEFLPSLSAKF
jgi:hypothetical protein